MNKEIQDSQIQKQENHIEDVNVGRDLTFAQLTAKSPLTSIVPLKPSQFSTLAKY